MENSYGIGVVNRYALFLDDDSDLSDPMDVLKAQEQAKELKKKTKEAEKENKGKPESKPKAASAAPRKGIKETQNVKSAENKNAEQKPKAAARPAGDRNADRPPPRRREDRPPNGTVDGRDGAPRPPRSTFDGKDGAPRPPRTTFDGKDGAPRPPRRDFPERRPGFERRNFDGEGQGGERRNIERRNFIDGEGGERRGPPRAPREPRDGPRPPRSDFRNKREFDRRSGSDRTGVKPVDKREGGGAHNWGTPRDDIDDINKTNSEGEQPEGEKVDGVAAAPPAEAKEGEAVPAPPVEEEVKELTLDEYKALRSANRPKIEYNIRKAGEGEDLTQWKNMVVLEKKKEKEDDEDSCEEFDMADFPQRAGRQKPVLGIQFTFNDNPRRGAPSGGRGRGRGGARGGGPMRGPRAPRDDVQHESREQQRQTAPPKVDDNKDFPSLG